VSASQTPPDRRSNDQLRSGIRDGNLGERRRAFLHEILRRREKAKTAGRPRIYFWLAVAFGVVSLGIGALTRRSG
jgi:hypothetical protein